MKIGDKVKLPIVQSIGPCNASRCNAIIFAKMNYQDHLVVTNIREDERGIVVTAAGEYGNKYAESDFMDTDLEEYVSG